MCRVWSSKQQWDADLCYIQTGHGTHNSPTQLKKKSQKEGDERVFVTNCRCHSFGLTDGTVSGAVNAVKRKREVKTLPQLFQVLIPDMMILFHFLSKLIVLLSELLAESL